MIVNPSFMEKDTAMMRGEKRIGGGQVVFSLLKKSRSSVEGDQISLFYSKIFREVTITSLICKVNLEFNLLAVTHQGASRLLYRSYESVRG